MSVAIESMAPPDSNSGATFLRDDRYFYKLAGSARASHLKSQSVWLASLELRAPSRFPPMSFAYWSTERAMQAFERVEVPVAATWMHAVAPARIARNFTDAIEWLSREVHRPLACRTTDAVRLTVRQTRQRLELWPADALLQQLRDDGARVRGRRLRPVRVVLGDAERLAATGKYDICALSRIHGDVHLGNLLTDLEQWWLIDPRGQFPSGGWRFDPYYEWGKIVHESHAQYSNVVRGAVRVVDDRAGMSLEVAACDHDFYTALHGATVASIGRLAERYGERRLDFNKLALFLGLILLGIVPFHAAYPQRTGVFVLAGLSVLEDLLEAERRGVQLESLPQLPWVLDVQHMRA